VDSPTTVSAATTPGAKSLPATIADAAARTGSASIPLTVASPPPAFVRISDIQGPAGVSPYVGFAVQTRGIVTALRSNGFFLQSAPGDEDGLPETSEGIFVFTSTAPAVGVGADVTVVGSVQEFVPAADPFQLPLTEIAQPSVTVNSTDNALPAPSR
jgi:predicted extracellular nuclease